MFTFPLTWVNNKCIHDEYKEHETLSSICIEGNCHAYVICFQIKQLSQKTYMMHM